MPPLPILSQRSAPLNCPEIVLTTWKTPPLYNEFKKFSQKRELRLKKFWKLFKKKEETTQLIEIFKVF